MLNDLQTVLGLPEATEAEIICFVSALKQASAQNIATIDQQKQTIAGLQSRLDFFQSTAEEAAADEALVAQKMTLGLSRQQAINVIRRQRLFDRSQVAQAHALPVAGETSAPETTPVLPS